MRSGVLAGAVLAALSIGAGGVRSQSPLAVEPSVSSAGLVILDSAHSASETERRLVEAAETVGLTIVARVDHAAAARGVGLELPPTFLVVFGNPRAGTLLMARQRTVGIDLPLKALVWEEGGRVRLSYSDPTYLASRHGLPGDLPVLSQMSNVLRKLSVAATSK